MRDLDGRRLPRRITGRRALEQRLQRLILAVHRFGRVRARSQADVIWAARTIDTLATLLPATLLGPGRAAFADADEP
jgi:hypothetical protein